ncbi:restriction endonuclease subunit S [Pseudonocardia spirodelae]|uniref:Type I restriction modification DNA specificity domain-containing protein n=1 Tax=Pseudonocardia spirodelae TaxID=3133431 RepID=A0ABU8T0G6_9PSEU
MQQHFNVKAAESIELTLPTLPEQEAIGNMLGSLDEKVAANEKVRLLVDDLLQAKFGRLCQGRGRAALRDIADVNAIAVKPQPGSNLRYLDISSVQQGFYVGPEETPWDSAPGRARRALRFGDTVWSTVRPNRRSHALILEDDPLLVASTGLAVLSPRPGRVAGTYEASRRDVFASYLESVAEGSAYPAVRGDRFEAAPIPNITTAEWESFERMALPLRMRVHAAEIESRVLMKARDELLPLLMSGRVKVREAERVASEVL